MFAVVEIPAFPLQAVQRLRPELRQAPVCILRGEGRRAVVAHASREAEGVRLGVSAVQALADCPGAVLLQPSPDAEQEACAVLLSASWLLSPRVEPTAPGRTTIDLTGADRGRLDVELKRILAQLSDHGLAARIGIGETPVVARYAAYVAQPVQIVADSVAFLSALPVAMLELTEAEANLLAALGLRTLGSITAFPLAAFTSRFGARGDELWFRAAGSWPTPLQAAPFPTRHCAMLELEEAVETLDPLLFVLRRFCERLAAEVGQFGGGTNRLSLALTLEGDRVHRREFALPEPTAKADVLFAVLEHYLASLQTDAPIVAITLEAFAARRLAQQEGLFDTGLKDAPMFFATLGRLGAVVGSDRVGTPRHGLSHRPDDLVLVAPASSIPERCRPSAPEAHGPLLWRLRPPIQAMVELVNAGPTYLSSSLVEGPVAVLRRPFRLNGGWWGGESWAREEWDVQIGTGLYRLLHEPQGWFIEGIYD